MKPASQTSVKDVLQELRARIGNPQFLALGQTVLWDEPMKAAWRRLLDIHSPQSQLIAGVHDSDYFAKTTALVHSDQKYVMLAHDDGATRGLWSAAGEISALMGSEDVPTRAFYEAQGVPFNWLAGRYPAGKAAFWAELTAAWGWRGLVCTEPHAPIAHDVPVRQIAPALLAQLDWAFSQSAAQLTPAMRPQAEALCARIRGWVTDFLAGCSEECTLTDLYRDLLPRLYELLLLSPPSHFEATHTLALLQFNCETAALPRFAILEVFLQPATRDMACAAYNQAVHGGGMYTLESFGPGALPFDIVLPGKGRGTLHVTSDAVAIDWPDGAARHATPKRIETNKELAALLQEQYGDRCALVGKAVALIDMLAGEFVLVFHEGASGYTPRTKAMNDRLRAAGVALELQPIVRLAYPTWEAVGEASGALHPPAHLARAFGVQDRPLPLSELSTRWADVAAEQAQQLARLRGLRKPRAIIAYLEENGADNHCWQCCQDQYETATGVLKSIAKKSAVLRDQIEERRAEIAASRAQRQHLEREKGDDYRARLRPLQEKLHRFEINDHRPEALELRRLIAQENERRIATYEAQILVFQERIRTARHQIRVIRAEQRAIERSKDARAAREQIAQAAYEAQMAKMELVRTAFLTTQGLPHTQARPTAWWLPLVDPSGAWFSAIAAGAQARLEEI